MNITSMDLSSGAFSGTEGQADNSGTISGVASGDNVTMHFRETSPQPSYSEDRTGQISRDGSSMSGMWTDSEGHSGTWSATCTSGQCAGGTPDLPLVSEGGVPASVQPGHLFQNDLWFFSDTDERAQPSDYTVTINWGDGNTTPGFVETSEEGTGGGSSGFAVGGTHKYRGQHQYTATATVVDHAPYDAGGQTVSIQNQTSIAVIGSAIGDKTRLAADAAASTFFAILGCGGLGAVDVATLGWFTPLAIAGCGGGAGFAAGAIDAANNDPPSAHYRRLFRPPHVSVPSLSSLRRHCQSLRPAACRRLTLLERPYLAAFAQVTSSSEALGVTANRFTAAALHHDRLWIKRQRNAARTFDRMLRHALALRRSAGRKLARALTHYKLDVVLSGSSLDASTFDLYHGHSVPSTTLRRVIREGLIASPTDLGHRLYLALHKRVRPSVLRLTQLLAQ